jgi:hypothetical protein
MLYYKEYNKKVFAIFSKAVREARVVGVNSNVRGVVVGKRLRFETAGQAHPIVVDIRKRDIFEDEEVANKTFFVRSLEGEYND